MNKSEEELVRELGEKIGYGNMMDLASECWSDDMIKNGYPTSGVFITALPSDSNQRVIEELEEIERMFPNDFNDVERGAIWLGIKERIKELKQD